MLSTRTINIYFALIENIINRKIARNWIIYSLLLLLLSFISYIDKSEDFISTTHIFKLECITYSTFIFPVFLFLIAFSFICAGMLREDVDDGSIYLILSKFKNRCLYLIGTLSAYLVISVMFLLIPILVFIGSTYLNKGVNIISFITSLVFLLPALLFIMLIILYASLYNLPYWITPVFFSLYQLLSFFIWPYLSLPDLYSHFFRFISAYKDVIIFSSRLLPNIIGYQHFALGVGAGLPISSLPITAFFNILIYDVGFCFLVFLKFKRLDL